MTAAEKHASGEVTCHLSVSEQLCDEEEGGDLGLGMGLRPGAIPKNDNADYDTEISMLIRTNHKFDCKLNGVTECCVHHRNTNYNNNCTNSLERATQSFQNVTTNGSDNTNDPHEFQRRSDSAIMIGTSIRQQRCVFAEDLNAIIEKNCRCCCDDLAIGGEHPGESTSRKSNIIETKLHETQQQVQHLKSDLSLCQQQLVDKYRTMRVVHCQAVAAQNEQKSSTRKAKSANKKLQKEINQLEFELEHLESIMINSEQRWSCRFDSVSVENCRLESVLAEKNEELGRLQKENQVITRERDELLALLDAKERLRLAALRPTYNDDSSTYSDMQLSMLGACRCSPKPCVCAQTAAALNNTLDSMHEKMSLLDQRRQEGLATTEAYRHAFEEQLERNRLLICDLTQLTTPTDCTDGRLKDGGRGGIAGGKVEKAKAAVRFLLRNLHEQPHDSPTNSSDMVMTGREPDTVLIRALVDVVNEKSAALVRQRLATQILVEKQRQIAENGESSKIVCEEVLIGDVGGARREGEKEGGDGVDKDERKVSGDEG